MRMSGIVLLSLAWLTGSAFAETVEADATLKALGFRDFSYLYSAGQTVSDRISGDFNIQAGADTTGGEVVTVACATNDFTGGAFVKSGTLVIPSLGSSYLETALGRTRTADGATGAPISILRVDMASGSSGAITGFKVSSDAVLHIDNYEGKMRGSVQLPLSVSGAGTIRTVCVNGVPMPNRRATVIDGRLTCCCSGFAVFVR